MGVSGGEPAALFGTFSEPGCLAAGDNYVKPPATKLPRHSGKQFSTAPPRKGGGADVLLDRTVRSLGEGAPYTDAWLLQSRMKRAPGKPVSDKPFVTLVGRKGCISTGPGSMDGCIGSMPVDIDGSVAAKHATPTKRPADAKRNIYTSGSKTGGVAISNELDSWQGFGRPWQCRTLGDPPKYYSDVFDGGRLKEKEMTAAAKVVSPKPFIAAAVPGRTFSKAPPLAPAAQSGSGSAYAAGVGSNGDAAACGAKAAAQLKAWRSPGPPKKGAAYCVLSHVGRDFVPDPAHEAKFQRKAGGEMKPFKPVGSCHNRLSMRDVNPYATVARPAPDMEFTLFRS